MRDLRWREGQQNKKGHDQNWYKHECRWRWWQWWQQQRQHHKQHGQENKKDYWSQTKTPEHQTLHHTIMLHSNIAGSHSIKMGIWKKLGWNRWGEFGWEFWKREEKRRYIWVIVIENWCKAALSVLLYLGIGIWQLVVSCNQSLSSSTTMSWFS